MMGWMSRMATKNPFHSPHRRPVAQREQQDDEMRIAGVDPPGDHRAAHGNHRADRKIDALGADHHRHAEGDHGGRHGAIKMSIRLPNRRPSTMRMVKKPGDTKAVDDQDERQRQQRPYRPLAGKRAEPQIEGRPRNRG